MSPKVPHTLDITAWSVYQLKASFTARSWEKVSLWEAKLEVRARFLWINPSGSDVLTESGQTTLEAGAVAPFEVSNVLYRHNVTRFYYPRVHLPCLRSLFGLYLRHRPGHPVGNAAKWQLVASVCELHTWFPTLVTLSALLNKSNKLLFLIVSNSLKRLKNWNL